MCSLPASFPGRPSCLSNTNKPGIGPEFTVFCKFLHDPLGWPALEYAV